MNTITFLTLMATNVHYSEKIPQLISKQSSEIQEAVLTSNAEHLKKQLGDTKHPANMCHVVQS
jgi:hypothetical protein